MGKFRDRENRAQVLPFLPAGMHCLADEGEESLPVGRTSDQYEAGDFFFFNKEAERNH